MGKLTSNRDRRNGQAPHGRVRFALVFTVAAILLTVGGFMLWREFRGFSNAPLLHDSSAHLKVELPVGGGLAQLLNSMRNAGIETGPTWRWKMLLQQLGLAQKLKAGEYEIDIHTTPKTLFYALAEGKVVQYKLTILEGTTFAQLRALLAQQENLVHDSGGLNDKDLLQSLGSDAPHPEGLFLPETYFYPKGFSEKELLSRAYWALQKTLDQEWKNRAPDLPLKSSYEALILATIVEKESGYANDRDDIAGVFVRRLKLGMKLQTDPSIIYGLGDAFDGDLRSKDLSTDTPYNTYTRFGLPPTPIALASKQSIIAALHPAEGNALFFVATGRDGRSHFSATYAEHKRAVDKYILGKQ
jgi:UPF0755 protein